MKSFIVKILPIIILMVLAFLSRFLFLNYPAEAVFDEVHFGKFVSAYFANQYYFDIHPALGKLMIAGFAKIFGLGFSGNFEELFSQIGQPFDKNALFILRFLPAFFSSLFVLLVYKFILALNLSRKAAFLGAFLVLFDNAILAQSKFILLDIFLLFFGFLGFYLFLASRKAIIFSKKYYLFLLASAIFTGMSFSVKWTALSFLAVIFIFILFDFIKTLGRKDFFLKLGIFIVIPFLIYFAVTVIHLKILSKSGSGDAFMSQAFQKTLIGNRAVEEVKPLSLFGKFVELNTAMYRYNAGITTQHPYSSKWYQWLIGKKPIWYWSKSVGEGQSANIYLIANPLVWFPILLALIYFIGMVLLNDKFRKKISFLNYLLVIGFFLNLLPYLFIGRVTFLYHYLPSLVFGILILVGVFDFLDKKLSPKIRLLSYSIFLAMVFWAFLILAPLTYGLPVSQKLKDFYELLVKII